MTISHCCTCEWTKRRNRRIKIAIILVSFLHAILAAVVLSLTKSIVGAAGWGIWSILVACNLYWTNRWMVVCPIDHELMGTITDQELERLDTEPRIAPSSIKPMEDEEKNK